jgi:hypothetical protein
LIQYWRTNYASFGATSPYLPYGIPFSSGTNAAFARFANWHFNGWGNSEGRKWRFNAEDYRIRYTDLQSAFAMPGFQKRNQESEALATHFVSFGYFEGRTHNYFNIDSITLVKASYPGVLCNSLICWHTSWPL